MHGIIRHEKERERGGRRRREKARNKKIYPPLGGTPLIPADSLSPVIARS